MMAKPVSEQTTMVSMNVWVIETSACVTGSRVFAAAAAASGIRLEVIKLDEAKRGFVLLPRRWVVERTLSWIDQQRRMSKDYERSCASGEALVYAAMIRLMTRRLARV